MEATPDTVLTERPQQPGALPSEPVEAASGGNGRSENDAVDGEVGRLTAEHSRDTEKLADVERLRSELAQLKVARDELEAKNTVLVAELDRSRAAQTILDSVKHEVMSSRDSVDSPHPQSGTAAPSPVDTGLPVTGEPTPDTEEPIQSSPGADMVRKRIRELLMGELQSMRQEGVSSAASSPQTDGSMIHSPDGLRFGVSEGESKLRLENNELKEENARLLGETAALRLELDGMRSLNQAAAKQLSNLQTALENERLNQARTCAAKAAEIELHYGTAMMKRDDALAAARASIRVLELELHEMQTLLYQRKLEGTLATQRDVDPAEDSMGGQADGSPPRGAGGEELQSWLAKLSGPTATSVDARSSSAGVSPGGTASNPSAMSRVQLLLQGELRAHMNADV